MDSLSTTVPMWKPVTGEPYPGDPAVRFRGRGSYLLLPLSYPFFFAAKFLSCSARKKSPSGRMLARAHRYKNLFLFRGRLKIAADWTPVIAAALALSAAEADFMRRAHAVIFCTVSFWLVPSPTAFAASRNGRQSNRKKATGKSCSIAMGRRSFANELVDKSVNNDLPRFAFLCWQEFVSKESCACYCHKRKNQPVFS